MAGVLHLRAILRAFAHWVSNLRSNRHHDDQRQTEQKETIEDWVGVILYRQLEPRGC